MFVVVFASVGMVVNTYFFKSHAAFGALARFIALDITLFHGANIVDFANVFGHLFTALGALARFE